MENPRTESARANDDSELIENIEPAPGFSSSSGTPVARDIASEAELTEISEPDASTRVRKEHAIEHGQEVRPDRARAAD
jgi:hypothetical protein